MIPLVAYTLIMMIEQQSTGSASPTGLALYHSGEEKSMETVITGRAVTVKTICDMSGNLPRTVLAPNSTPGDNHDCSVQIRRIVNVPQNISDSAVVHIFTQTVEMSGFGGRPKRFEFDYAELGAGKIIR